MPGANVPVTLAAEGVTDVPIAKRMLRSVGLELGPVHTTGGKARLDDRLRGFNRAAAYSPWLVLRDLDHDAPCAPTLAQRLLPGPSARMCFRIAVREGEAWLLADRERIAEYLAVGISRVPSNPDGLGDPKQTLIDLARQSRAASVRDDMIPEAGTTARVGPGYVARITEFSREYWRPLVAAQSSDSLARSLAALRRLDVAV
jgi:hypothetical protein